MACISRPLSSIYLQDSLVYLYLTFLFFNLRLFFILSCYLSIHWKDFFNPLPNILKDFVLRRLFRVSHLPHCPNIYQMSFLMFFFIGFSLAAFKRNKRKLELAERVETDFIQLKKRRQSSEKVRRLFEILINDV